MNAERKVSGPKIRTFKPTRPYQSALAPGDVSMARLSREIDRGYRFFFERRPHLAGPGERPEFDFNRTQRGSAA